MPSWDPKSFKNQRKTVSKKQNDFETKLACRTTTSEPSPPYARALFPKQSGQDEEGRRREERKKGRRKKKEKGQEGREKYPGSDTPGARGLANFQR